MMYRSKYLKYKSKNTGGGLFDRLKEQISVASSSAGVKELELITTIDSNDDEQKKNIKYFNSFVSLMKEHNWPLNFKLHVQDEVGRGPGVLQILISRT